jgi:hypothetical protein
MNLPAGFAVIVGLGMIGQWTASFAARGIPEHEDEPYRIWFHIAGEMATALLLITGGVAIFLGWASAPAIYLVAIGMLIYTAIVSLGYFAQRGQWTWVVIFFVIIVLSVASAFAVAGGMAM